MKLTEEHAARIYIEAAEWTDEWAEREPSEPTKQQTNAMFVRQIHARYDFAAQVTPVPQDGDERARFDEWYASQWPLSFAAIKSDTTDDDDVWDSYRMAELAWQAALASNKAAAVAVGEPIYVPVATSSWEEVEGRHPNDKTPQDADCQKALNQMGDDKGQGLSSYWKWGFRSGWRAALDHRLLQDHVAASVATPTAPIASAEEWNSLTYLCSLLPADVHWGDDLTPDIARQIVQAAATHPAAAQPSRAPEDWRKLAENAKSLRALYFNTNCNPEGFRHAVESLADDADKLLKDKP